MLIKRTTKGSALTYQEMDDNLDYLENIAQSGSDLSTVLTAGNNTGGSNMLIDPSDTLDINGTVDFTNSTIVGLNTSPETLSQTLTAGNITNGNDIVISSADTLDVDGTLRADGTTQINGDLLLKSTVYNTTSNVSRNTTIHEIDITSQIELTMFEASGYERINFIKVDGTTNDASILPVSGQNFIVNGVQVNQLTLSNYDSITLWFSKTHNLWFEVK